jgi:hypothetical protein
MNPADPPPSLSLPESPSPVPHLIAHLRLPLHEVGHDIVIPLRPAHLEFADLQAQAVNAELLVEPGQPADREVQYHEVRLGVNLHHFANQGVIGGDDHAGPVRLDRGDRLNCPPGRRRGICRGAVVLAGTARENQHHHDRERKQHSHAESKIPPPREINSHI